VIKDYNRAPGVEAGAFAHEDETLMRLVASVAAIIVVMATVVAAFAGERPFGSPPDSRPDRDEMISRPPALIPSSRANAAVAPKTNSTDRHAAEFLRWKDQHAGPTR
jgi:hypothetical protein